MKTITYNPETHVLMPRDLIADAKQIFCSDVEPNTNGDCLDVIEWFNAMLAVAPQPEPTPNWCAGCSPDNCSCCGAEPVYQICKADSVSISGAWIDVDKQTYHDAGLYKEYKLRSLYTTPQPDRTAELEQLHRRVAELEKEREEFAGYAKSGTVIAAQQQMEITALKSALKEARESLDAIRFAVEPYNDIKPRDWKSDRANLRDAHQCARETLAKINEVLK